MGTTRGTYGERPDEEHDQISIEEANGVLIMHLRGQFLGGEETERLRAALHDIPGTITRVVLDLAGVSFVNSSFLSSLLAEHTAHRRHGREVCLVNVRPTVETILRLTHLSSVIPVLSAIEDAAG